MTSSLVDTDVALWPGPLDEETAASILRLVIEEYEWIKPAKIGDDGPSLAGPLEARLSAAIGALQDEGQVFVLGPSRGSFIGVLPGRFGNLWFRHKVVCTQPTTAAGLHLERHCPEVSHLMKTVDAPWAMSGLEEARRAFSRRLTEEGIFVVETATLNGYHQGLEHAHWRMWFREPYISFFGMETLASAPAMITRQLEDGTFFFQLYEDPSEWDQATGQDAAERFMEHLGRDCFYDPEQHEQKLRAPDLTPWIEAGKRAWEKLGVKPKEPDI